MHSKVVEIGSKALNNEEDIIILFDEKATKELKNVSVIQRFENSDSYFDLNQGSKIIIDHMEYQVIQIGDLANQHLQDMGHVTLVFKDSTDMDELANAIFLYPHHIPQIKVGSELIYQT